MIPMRCLFVIRCVAVAIASVVAATASLGADAARFTLENGLRVILRPVEGADEVALLVCFDFGENADPIGKSGLTHFIEHLYFTAAAGDTPVRTFDELVNRYQGMFNAQTGEDYTVFAAVFPASELDGELADAASRMRELKITQGDVDRERPRILLELSNMYGGISGLGALNRAREALRPSPPGARKGGATEVIETLTLEELKDAAGRWHKPANARLVITGAFEAEKMRTRIETLFGPIPGGEKPEVQQRSFVERPETQIVRGTEPGAPGVVVLAYPCPPAGREHASAASMIVPRLFARAQAAGEMMGQFPPPVFHPVLDDPYLLYVGARMREGETAELAIKRLDDAVAHALEGPVQENERTNVRMGAGMFLGYVDPPPALPGQGLYGLAFSLARRSQLGIVPEDVARQLGALDEAAMRAAQEAVFNPERRAAVVIVPMATPEAGNEGEGARGAGPSEGAKPESERTSQEHSSNGPGGS